MSQLTEYNNANYGLMENHAIQQLSSDENGRKVKIRDLEWSLAPISGLLKLATGIETSLRPGRMYRECRLLLILFSALTVASNFGSFLINYSLSGHLNTKDTKPNKAKQDDNNSAVAERRWVEIGSSILPVLVHLSLFLIQFTKSWRGLWYCIKDIEEQLKLGDTFCTRYRSFIVMACIIPVLECVNAMWGLYFLIAGDFTASLKFFGDSKYLMLGFAFMNCCASFASMLVPVLTYAVIVFAALLFSLLSDHITDLANIGSRSLDPIPALDAVNEWKRLHFLVTRLVDRINRTLGMVTLLVMVRGFVNIMVNSYNMAAMENTQKEEDKWGLKIFNWGGMSLEVLYVSLLIFSAHFMHREIVRMKNNLMRLNTSSHPHIQNMIVSALTQVVNKKVVITAAGFFEVNLSLYPTLVGTFVSYILLIYQRATDKPEEGSAAGPGAPQPTIAGGKC